MADIDEMDEGNAASGKGNNTLLLVALAAILVLAGAGGGWFFFMRQPAEVVSDGAAVVTPAGPVQYVELAPAFIVNFPHQGRQRFLQANITVMGRDAQAMEAVIQHMPVLRHNLINLLSARLLLVFEDPSGIEQLRQLATEEVKQVMRREIGRDGIEEVLFTNFVMQ